jgi:hypothetical protein
MNKVWHEQNKMPKNATTGERLSWHREHQKHCGCRPIPQSLRSLIDDKPAMKKRVVTRARKKSSN